MKKEQESEQTEEKVSKWSLIKYNYQNNPPFKALIKLLGYFVFFIVIISVVAIGNDSVQDSKPQYKESTTNKINEKNYHDMLEDLRTTTKSINYEITIGDNKYLLTENITDSEVTGLLENKDNIIKFSIKDNIIYEIKLNEYIPNSEIFANFNGTYINIISLIDLISANKATKMLENDCVVYNYVIDENTFAVTTKDSVITNIVINSEGTIYDIKVETED